MLYATALTAICCEWKCHLAAALAEKVIHHFEDIMQEQASLAEALRRRATWLNQSNKTNSHLEYGWADTKNVVGALLEMADVVDSWSGEYISKEDAEEEYYRRRYGYTDENGVRHPGDYDAKPLTHEERRATKPLT